MKELSRIASAVQASTTMAIDSMFKQMKADGIDVIGFAAGEPDFNTPDEIKAIQLDPDTGLADETQYSIGETLDKQKWSCIEAFPDAPWDQAVGFRIKVWQDFYKEHEKFCTAMNTFLGVSDCI